MITPDEADALQIIGAILVVVGVIGFILTFVGADWPDDMDL